MLSVPLSRIIDVVCFSYEIEPTELGSRGSRHPARAALAYLARNHTMSTNAELAAVLGLSRAESVPNLTRRFGDCMATDAKTRKKLGVLESEL
jgi:hypothetical protein